MLANERRLIILEMIKSQSAVTTAELTERFDVSIETIRKDLMFLEKNNQLNRVHGGAVIKAASGHWLDLQRRINDNKEAKRELSRLATELINEGDTIAVDAGSTALEFAQELKERFKTLTVVTHSLDVFNRINGFKNFTVILCGGYFLSEENAFYGAFTIKMLDDIHVGKAFIFPSAVSIKHGVCDYNPLLYDVQKKLLTVADQIIVLADSSKFEKNALLKVCDIDQKHIYVSDSALPAKIKEIYKSNNINIITAKEDM